MLKVYGLILRICFKLTDIECFSCGKTEKEENYKKNIKFYVNWIEIFPDKWLCRDCKENKYDRNVIIYKMPFKIEEDE